MFGSQVEVCEDFGLGILLYESDVMTRFCSLVFALLIINYISARAQGSIDALETRKGFRDAKVGMPFSAFKGMNLVKPSEFSVSFDKANHYPIEYIKEYERISDSKRLGSVPLRHIYYKFYQRRLYSIVVIADGQYESSFFRIFQTAYGEGQCTRFPDGEVVCYWVAQTVELNCRNHSALGKSTNAVRAEFVSSSISEEISKEQKKREERAKFNRIDGL